MSEAMSGPVQSDPYGHEYKPGYDFDEGYGRCKHCDCRENTNSSVITCPKRIFTLREEADWILREREQDQKIEKLQKRLESAASMLENVSKHSGIFPHEMRLVAKGHAKDIREELKEKT